jgi:hypothetical protein
VSVTLRRTSGRSWSVGFFFSALKAASVLCRSTWHALAGRQNTILLRELLPAIATIRTAVDLLDDQSSRRELALHLAEDVCRHAAARCRRYGLDQSLLRCAAACERAVDEVELLLTSLSHDATD